MSISPWTGRAIGAGAALGFSTFAAYKRYRASRAKSSIVRYKAPYRMKQRSYRGVDKRFLKNYLRLTETKFIDNNALSETPIAGTSDIVLINGVGSGDTFALRDGENILVTSVQYNLKVLADKDMIKDVEADILLVLQKDTRSNTMTIAELFDADNLFAMRQITNSKNLKILHRWKTNLRCFSIAGSQHQEIHRYYHKFKKPIKVKYDGTGATISSIDRNALYLVFMTDAATTFLPTFSGSVRVSFKDV